MKRKEKEVPALPRPSPLSSPGCRAQGKASRRRLRWQGPGKAGLEGFNESLLHFLSVHSSDGTALCQCRDEQAALGQVRDGVCFISRAEPPLMFAVSP